MQLFIVILAIGFLQVWGAENPFHRDAWFRQWIQRLDTEYDFIKERFLSIASIAGPLLVLIILSEMLASVSQWLLLPLGVIVLLYSFGRGEFSSIITEYTRACYREDWVSAIERAERFGVSTQDVNENDWSELHRQVLNEAGYRGFERLFAVLFWFFVLGTVGALAYRLLMLYVRERPDDGLAQKWLWLMEWPVVRLLGLSFAVTGNFVGCYKRWRECLFCGRRGTVDVLSESILGALSIDDDISQTCEVTRKELGLMYKLYTRTLWFWLAVVSFLIIMI